MRRDKLNAYSVSLFVVVFVVTNISYIFKILYTTPYKMLMCCYMLL